MIRLKKISYLFEIAGIAIIAFWLSIIPSTVDAKDKPAPAILKQATEIFVQNGHALPVNSVAFSPDGRSALSGGNDANIKLWEVASGREIKKLLSLISVGINYKASTYCMTIHVVQRGFDEK